MKPLLIVVFVALPLVAFGERLHHFEPEVIVGAGPSSLTWPTLRDVLFVVGVALSPALFTVGLHLGRVRSHRVRHVRLG